MNRNVLEKKNRKLAISTILKFVISQRIELLFVFHLNDNVSFIIFQLNLFFLPEIFSFQKGDQFIFIISKEHLNKLVSHLGIFSV